MPSTRRWSVPHERVVACAILVAVGLFLVCGSVGMGKWPVGAVGVAILAIGAGIFVLSALNSRAMSEIEGTAHVVSASAPPSGVSRGRCRLNLIVHAKGIEAVSVKIRDPAVPVAKWPDAGMDVPVLVAIDNPQRVRIRWWDVRAHGDLADEMAADRARVRDGHARMTGMDSGAMDADEQFVDLIGDAIVVEEPDRSEHPTSEDNTTTDAVTEVFTAAYGPEGDAPLPAPLAIGAAPVGEAEGGRVIELDVMDPSSMWWSPPSAPQPRRAPGSRPSPRPRRSATTREPGTPTGSDVPDLLLPDDPAVPESVPPDHVGAPNDSVPAATSVPADGLVVQVDAGTPASGHPAPPAWPPLSPAAAEAAARRPHQWDAATSDGETAAGDSADTMAASKAARASIPGGSDAQDRSATAPQPVPETGPSSADTAPGPAIGDSPSAHPPLPRDAIVAISFGDFRDDATPRHHRTPDDNSSGASDGTGHRVPRNRPAPGEEVFDQEEPSKDGPGYASGAAYSPEAAYDDGPELSPGTDYAGPGNPT